MKLRELEYKDLLELIDFIDEHFKGQDDIKTKVLMVLRKFIPNLDGFQLIVLMNFLEERTEERYNNLILAAGDTLFDPTGKSEPTESDFLKMNFDMIEDMSNSELKDTTKTSVRRRHREIKAAKTLEPLLSIKSNNLYTQKKKLFLRKNIVNKDALEKIENILKNNNIRYMIVLEKVIDYMSNRSEDNARVFFEHFSIRIEYCFKDKDFADIRNIEFYENLKKISS